MADHPTGIVTLVFTDLEGSSELSEKHGAAFEPHRDQHFQLLRHAASHWNGYEVETAGDSLFVVFPSAPDAVQFTVEAQQLMATHQWPAEIGTMRVRIGMHTGEPFIGLDNGRPTYRGPVTNRAARVQAAGHGGQVLVSQSARELAEGALPPDFSLRDLGRHRLKGVGEEHLWQVCHPLLPDEFPALNSLPAARHNLPLPQTPFVGREELTRECLELLRKTNTRLLTLLAFGGMGKSRQALQVAELAFDDFKDGVWWINIENATTGDEMVLRIAEQLRLHLQPQPSVREQIWDFHRDRQLLLVLDNTEQVQGDEAAQVIHELLNAGQRIKCLVTSRRSLNLASEQIIEMPPLPSDESQTLFAQRASARKASFAINEKNQDDVAAICTTLEGVPLAIEIAASLIVLLAPRQILSKLHDQLRVLVTRDPAKPRRQQALRAAIDWSHDLLSPEARSLFARLAVFAGGFSMEAAEAVCLCDDDVLDGLLELRNHSLLRSVTDENSQQERMVMLESVRAYAAEKLRDNSEEHSLTARRHAEYFLGFLEEQTASLSTSEETEALGLMEGEFDNVRAALQWAAVHDAALCAKLALVFHQPLHARGLWSEAGLCLKTGWQAAVALGESGKALRAHLRHGLAAMAHDMGELEEACNQAELNLQEFRELGDRAGEANALNLLALLATEADDKAEAQRLCEAALQCWPAGQVSGRAKTLHNMARLAARRGETDAARRLYEESLVLRKRAGDARGEAATLGNLGVLAQEMDDFPRARDYYTRSLKLRHALRDRHGIAIMLYNLGELGELENDVERALALYLHAERIFGELQSPYAAAPLEKMDTMREQQGQEKYAVLLERTEKTAWEDIV